MRDVLGDARGEADAEEIDQRIFRDAITVARGDEAGTFVGLGDFGLEDVEARDGAGVEPALLVVKLLVEQVDGGFFHGDLFGGLQDVVIGDAHLQEAVRDDGLVIEQRLFFRQFRGAQWRN